MKLYFLLGGELAVPIVEVGGVGLQLVHVVVVHLRGGVQGDVVVGGWCGDVDRRGRLHGLEVVAAAVLLVQLLGVLGIGGVRIGGIGLAVRARGELVARAGVDLRRRRRTTQAVLCLLEPGGTVHRACAGRCGYWHCGMLRIG